MSSANKKLTVHDLRVVYVTVDALTRLLESSRVFSDFCKEVTGQPSVNGGPCGWTVQLKMHDGTFVELGVVGGNWRGRSKASKLEELREKNDDLLHFREIQRAKAKEEAEEADDGGD
jgi:hypothetical protein